MNEKDKKNVLLIDGNHIPIVGLGTWRSEKGIVGQAVHSALKAGYRHIDCAFIYRNESEIGEAFKKAFQDRLVTRNELFVTSKCWLTYLQPDRVKKCLQLSLQRLGLDYLDLYLMHWPMPLKASDNQEYPSDFSGNVLIDHDVDICDSWRTFEHLKREGLVRSIGVSNFNQKQLERLLIDCQTLPAVNQIECHPYLAQQSLIDYCHKQGITVTAYSPLGSSGNSRSQSVSSSGLSNDDAPHLLTDPIVNQIAQQVDKSPAQVLIRFQIQRGLTVIPKSVNPERLQQNLNVFDFELDPQQMQRLYELNQNHRYVTFDMRGLKYHPEYPFHETTDDNHNHVQLV